MGDGAHFTSLTNRIHSYIKTIGGKIAHIPMGLISDINGRVSQLDPMVLAIWTQDSVHGHMHEGHHFEVGIESRADQVATVACAFKIPSGTKRVHMTGDWRISDRGYIELIKNPTWDTNTGTVIPINNNSHVSANISQIEEDKTASPLWTPGGVLKDPDNITGGTSVILSESYTTKQAGGSVALVRNEKILDNDETYVVRIVKRSAGDVYMGFILQWYEHTDE